MSESSIKPIEQADFEHDARVIGAFRRADASITSWEMKLREYTHNRAIMKAMLVGDKDGKKPYWARALDGAATAGFASLALMAAAHFGFKEVTEYQGMATLGSFAVTQLFSKSQIAGQLLLSVVSKTLSGIDTLKEINNTGALLWKKHDRAEFLNTTAKLKDNPFNNYTELHNFCKDVVKKTHAFQQNEQSIQNVEATKQLSLWAHDLARNINIVAREGKYTLQEATFLALKPLKWAQHDLGKIEIIDLGKDNPAAQGRKEVKVLSTVARTRFNLTSSNIYRFFDGANDEDKLDAINLRATALESLARDTFMHGRMENAMTAVQGIGMAAVAFSTFKLGMSLPSDGPISTMDAIALTVAAHQYSSYLEGNKELLAAYLTPYATKTKSYFSELSAKARFGMQIKTLNQHTDPMMGDSFADIKRFTMARIDEAMAMEGITADGPMSSMHLAANKESLALEAIHTAFSLKLKRPNLPMENLLNGTALGLTLEKKQGMQEMLSNQAQETITLGKEETGWRFNSKKQVVINVDFTQKPSASKSMSL